jgi:hypothetical protein
MDVNARESEASNRALQQFRQRQLGEFRAEHAHRIRPFDGAAHVGSVVAAAIGAAIVHIGRQEFVSVPLAPDAIVPEVGASVSVDRDGNVAVVSPENERDDRVIQRTSPERSL